MKNKLIIGGILVTSLLLPSFAFGETSSSVSASAKTDGIKVRADLKMKAESDLSDRMEAIKEKKEELQQKLEREKDEMKGKMEERKDGAIEKVKDRLDKFTQNIVRRFMAAVERLEKIALRLDSRIAKMEAAGSNVTEAKDLLVVANLKIKTAKTSVEGIDLEASILASSTSTTTLGIREGFQSLKDEIEKAKSDVKSAHKALIDVINSLKPGLNKPKATSTPETSTSTATTTS